MKWLVLLSAMACGASSKFPTGSVVVDGKALSVEVADDDALRALRHDIDACDAPPVTLLEGLEITFHPSARFKTLRFVEEALIPETY